MIKNGKVNFSDQLDNVLMNLIMLNIHTNVKMNTTHQIHKNYNITIECKRRVDNKF
jgi:hypothetical protein